MVYVDILLSDKTMIQSNHPYGSGWRHMHSSMESFLEHT